VVVVIKALVVVVVVVVVVVAVAVVVKVVEVVVGVLVVVAVVGVLVVVVAVVGVLVVVVGKALCCSLELLIMFYQLMILTLWFSILLRVYYKSSLTSTVRNFSLIYLFILFYF
jgi:hypothetical protein